MSSSPPDRPPPLAVTMGDPAGVGPELCLRLLAERSLEGVAVPIIFGDAVVLRRVAIASGLPFQAPIVPIDEWRGDPNRRNQACVVDLNLAEVQNVTPGIINAATGQAGYLFVDRAIDAAIAGQVAGVTTAPLNKEALHMAGIPFPGHTEMFAARTRSERWCMMQYSDEITCTFVTVHVGYAEVPRLLTPARILEVIELTAEALLRIRGTSPRLVVCGLNPHAGEHGLFGDREEERIILPAIEAARSQGIHIEGPLPPDTAFLPWKRRSTDAYVCMYHDQGHIPVKALAFHSAVNTTLGLPIVRTSVDHGTALDIAWKGQADPGSLFAAIRLATRLSRA